MKLTNLLFCALVAGVPTYSKSQTCNVDPACDCCCYEAPYGEEAFAIGVAVPEFRFPFLVIGGSAGGPNLGRSSGLSTTTTPADMAGPGTVCIADPSEPPYKTNDDVLVYGHSCCATNVNTLNLYADGAGALDGPELLAFQTDILEFLDQISSFKFDAVLDIVVLESTTTYEDKVAILLSTDLYTPDEVRALQKTLNDLTRITTALVNTTEMNVMLKAAPATEEDISLYHDGVMFITALVICTSPEEQNCIITEVQFFKSKLLTTVATVPAVFSGKKKGNKKAKSNSVTQSVIKSAKSSHTKKGNKNKSQMKMKKNNKMKKTNKTKLKKNSKSYSRQTTLVRVYSISGVIAVILSSAALAFFLAVLRRRRKSKSQNKNDEIMEETFVSVLHLESAPLLT
eukprot:m.36114 g.36114  ORF g.36114 m.36114 type:complete len:399 (+) comp9023_c0_seq2:107-1303(+)